MLGMEIKWCIFKHANDWIANWVNTILGIFTNSVFWEYPWKLNMDDSYFLLEMYIYYCLNISLKYILLAFWCLLIIFK